MGAIRLARTGHHSRPYEKTYNDPFGSNSYQTSGFKKKKGKVSAAPTMLSAKHIPNLEAGPPPAHSQKGSRPIVIIEITLEEKSRFDNTAAVLAIIRKYREDTYSSYHT